MANRLPPPGEMFTPAEVEMTLDEELRLLDDRPRVVRWFSAPGGTVPPVPTVDGLTFAEPWTAPWVQLNDPDTDEMDGVLIVGRGGDELLHRRGALFILTRPTEEARITWTEARTSGHPVALGAERVSAPGYRAFFPVVYAIPPVPGSVHLRFSVPVPLDDTPAWEVFAVAEEVPGPCEH